jgi:glycosyltransferase involved in cell wall biosynthesis
MLVGLNARLLTDPSLRGWNRYTINLAAALADLGVRLILYTDRPVHESHLARLKPGSFEERASGEIPYLSWEQRWAPKQCRLDKIDVFHCPFHFGLPWSNACPQVLTLHDAIDVAFKPQTQARRDRWSRGAIQTRLHFWIARKRADRVATVSEHAKRDIHRYFGVPIERIVVTPEAADPIFHRTVEASDRDRARTTHSLDRPYFFYVGGWEERKNLPFLLRAFAAADLRGIELVFGGGKPTEREALLAQARELGIDDRLRLLGWIEERDLPAIYAGAIAFVYPSAYEGFGLQLCEAMAVGTATIASRATSLPEVLGNGGDTFNLDDPGELAGLLKKIAEDESYRSQSASRAKERSTDFTWKKTAEKTLAIYEELVRMP